MAKWCVICEYLDGTFSAKMFESIESAVSHADESWDNRPENLIDVQIYQRTAL